MGIRDDVRRLLANTGTSMRQLAVKSGVRRQSIMHFLSGGSIHIDNLEKLTSALGHEFVLSMKGDARTFEKRIKIDREKLCRFCKDNSISSVSLFGSILRDDFGKDSDIDIVIDMKRPVTFFELAEIEDGLKKMFDTKHELDIVTDEGMSKLIRAEVEKSKEVLYDEAA